MGFQICSLFRMDGVPETEKRSLGMALHVETGREIMSFMLYVEFEILWPFLPGHASSLALSELRSQKKGLAWR